MYTHTCIYWKESRQYLEKYTSVQLQGVGVGGGCAPSCAEHKAKDNLKVKMHKTLDLDSFAIEGESFPHVLCI